MHASPPSLERLEPRLLLNGTFPAFQTPWPGSLIYDSSATGTISVAGETDGFTLDLDPGQTITVVARPQGALQPTIELSDASGPLGSAAAGGAGKDAVLQTVSAASGGTYTIAVGGAAGTTGDYTVEAVLNAAVEAEEHDGPYNNALAMAQDLDGSFMTLAGDAQRAAALGDAEATPITMSLEEDFTGGSLGPAWSTYSSDPSGRIQVLAGVLSMSRASFGTFVLNEAIWTVDVPALPDVSLGFWRIGIVETDHDFAGAFTGHYNADGIAISDDGVNWHPIWNASQQTADLETIDLSGAAAAAGVTLGPGLQIKFQQYDAMGLVWWDNISISVPLGRQDWYGFTLDGGESSTLAVNSAVVGGSGHVELYDAAGTLLATGAPTGPTNVIEAITDFVAPTAGNYYARVTGELDYGLVVTRGATFDLEWNNNWATAQDITNGGVAFGEVGPNLNRLFVGWDGTQVKELDPLTGQQLGNWWVPVSVYSGRFGMATTESTLLLGGSPYSPIVEVDPDTHAVIRYLGPSGKRVSGIAYSNREVFLATLWKITVLDYQTGAVKRVLPLSQGYNGLAASSDKLLAVSAGVLYELDPLTGAGTMVATLGEIGTSDAGLGVIGNELFVNNGDKKIEVYDLATLTWKRQLTTTTDHIYGLGADAPGYDGDYYAVAVQAGDNLTVETLTPAGGPGEFVNDLDPAIELLDPDGSVVAGDDNSRGDGRNALVAHTAAFSGIYTVRVYAAGTRSGEYVLRVGGHTVLPDLIGPVVVASSIQDGQTLSPGELTYVARFGEAMKSPRLDPSDFSLVGLRTGAHAANSFDYDPGTNALTLQYSGLAEEDYTLTLLSGNGAFEDLAGNDLDGEANWPLPSGNGFAGGDFVVNFTLDHMSSPFPTPFEPLPPSGSLAYESSTVGWISVPGDVDGFTVDLDPNQSVTVLAYPDATLQPAVEVSGATGLLGSVAAAAPGQTSILQTAPAVDGGTYTISVAGAGGTTGDYTVRVILNAAEEVEEYGGRANDTLAAAQDLDAGFTALTGSAERTAVIGALPGWAEDFETGTYLGPDWSTYSSHWSGVITVTRWWGSASGNRAMWMGHNLTSHGGATLNEAVWTVDLSGVSAADLGFWYSRNRDVCEPFAGDFTGHYNADGVAISDDGVHWHPIWNAVDQPDGTWQRYSFDLAAAADDAGMTLGPDFRVKFQQYAYDPIFYDRRGWDDILISIPAEDCYGFTLDTGQSATLALAANSCPGDVQVGLYDDSARLLGLSEPREGDFSDVIADFVAPEAGRYYARVTGSLDYTLTITRGAAFDIEPNDAIGSAQDISLTAVALGVIEDTGRDCWALPANAGDELTITTLTPAGGPAEFVNNLDPAIELYDPAGNLVAIDDNGAPDGRNALLTHTATATGNYTVRVSAVDKPGEYVLRATGQTAPPSVGPFEVAATDPNDGARLDLAPAHIVVDFSDSLLLSTVDASDLIFDGVALTGMTVADHDTVVFDLPAGLADGVHTVEIPAGAILDLQGTPIDAYAGHFGLDRIPPVVVGSSIQEGDAVAPGDTTCVVRFSEPLEEADLDASDVLLTSVLWGDYAPTSFNYEAANSTLTLEYSALPEDSYTLNLFSGDGALEDLTGHDLDGEANWPLPSGNGVAGGDFVVHFMVDVTTTAYPAPLEAAKPLGGLIYDSSTTGVIGLAGDLDSFALGVGPGQTITVVVVPEATLQPTIELYDPGDALIGSALSGGAGQDVVLQTVPAAAGGTYTVTVGGAAGSTGPYTVQVILNAAVEAEQHGGPSNDTLHTAQDIDPSFLALTGSARRGAVVGSLPLSTGAPVVGECFSRRALSCPPWTTYSSNSSGRIQVTGSYSRAEGPYALWMGRTQPGGPNPINEALWTVDLSGLTEATLSFWHAEAEYDDEEWFDGPFTGHRCADGVAISDDGVHWYPIWNARSQRRWQWRQYTIDLAAAAAAAGMTLGPEFRIKFQQYGGWALPYSGRGWDDILITTPVPPEDWYRFSLDNGESATLALAGRPSGSLSLELYDSAGSLLALGAGAVNADQAIEDFVASAAGTYYVRVTGNFGYNLVVTRRATFDIEPNDGPGLAAQNITLNGVALGALDRLVIRVEPDDYSDGTPLTNVAPGITLTAQGSSSAVTSWDNPSLAPSKRIFAHGTHPAWCSDSVWLRAEFVTPASSVSIDLYSRMGGDVGILHAFDFSGALLEEVTCTRPPEGSYATLTITRPSADIAYILASGLGSKTAMLDNLVVGGLRGSDDFYSVSANAGDSLTISTLTPAGGPGEFVNELDPAIELYDPAGNLVASDDNGAPDGRNALLTYMAAAAGDYTVRIYAIDEPGEYVLSVNVAPRVTSLVVDPAVIAENGTVTLAGSFVDPNLFDTHSVTIEWGDGAAETIPLAAGARDFVAGHQYLDDDPSGTPWDEYTISVTVSDQDSESDPATTTVTVNNVAPVVSVDLPPETAEYSDPFQPITITATDVAADTLTASVTDLPDWLEFGRHPTMPRTWVIWSESGMADAGPPPYDVVVTVEDDDTGSTPQVIPIVVQEDALADYTGATCASTSSTRSGTATVMLAATVRDITAAPDEPKYDPDPGDIRNATVKFVIHDAMTSELVAEIADVPVGLVDPADPKTGTATVNWTADIGAAGAKTYRVTVVAEDYYTGTSWPELITVAKPFDNSVTGGGYLINEASAGSFAGDPGLKTNFGFCVRTNRNGTARGHVVILVRRLEDDGIVHTYQIRTNAIRSFYTDEATGTAIFNAKATVQDVTDPLNPISIDGNASLQIALADNGEPGTNDTIGMTLWDKKGGLYFASYWDGVRTQEDELDGGNLQVR